MLLFNSVAAAIAALALFQGVFGAASTDEYRDADQLQSGYLPNHNMDPNVVDSAGFGQLWRVFTGGSDTNPADGGGTEQFMAKPLVYTTLKGGYGGKQVVIACSETNWIYVLDAVNGTIYNSRQLHRPFLVSDIGCNDINPQIGITGTPVIDPATDVMYVYSKTYVGAANGYQNGVYYFHAIDVNTLTDVYPPVNINGGPANNDPNNGIYFTGGIQLQRTSLSLIDGAVFAGFGGHCDLFNYTGWVVGIDAPTGKIFTRFATEVGPFAPLQDGTNDYKGGGGGSGIWQSGMSLTSDSNNRLFFVTGNDNAHANIEQAASGRAFLGTLGQAVVNLAIDPSTRQLSLADYFEPYEYISMDGGDRDLGSGGLCGLDPTVFKGTNVAHMGVTAGKNGKAYVVNMDNLGGFKNGANGGDLVIQTLQMPGGGPIFGGAGSYPLEGGYLYITPIGYATQVYKFVPDANGNPSFTQITQTPDISSGRVGAGIPTITTNGGAPGTAILWVTDVDAGLRAYYAVPQPDGSMKKINMPSTPAVHKYQRPAFGDGRLYLSTSDGHIICLGSPVALPFTCSAPIDFGSVTLGSTATLLINCTANIPVTSIIGLTLTNPLFTALNSSLPSGPLNTGQAFSFPATFNLTTASIQNSVNMSYNGVKPGVAAGSITLHTVNGVAGYSNNQPLALSGKTVSQNGFLSLSPVEVDFGGLVVDSAAAQAGLPGSLIISNIGVGSLTITGSSWADLHAATPTNVNITQIGSTGQYTLGPAFNATNWPQNGYTIPGGSSVSVTLNFKAANVGTYGSMVTIWSTGGSSQNVMLAGTMSNAPLAKLTVNDGEGGAWQPSITGITQDPSDGSYITEVGVNFGNLYPGNSSILRIRLNNTGGSSLLITKSKPPEGVELTAVNPTGDLPEGAQIAPNSFADGPVIFSPSLAISPPNSDPRVVSGTWTLNNNDLTFGVHVVNFTGTVIVPQHGPLDGAGRSIYKYLGCYLDAANGGARLLTQSTDNGVNNENGLCQNTASAAGAVFAGTEYHTQCWWGNTIPNITFFNPESANYCTWTCPADISQPCGGEGGYISIFYDSTKYNPTTGVCTGCGAVAAGGGGGGGGGVTGIIEKTVGAYNYVGCYTEATTGRALSPGAFAYDTMTPDTCAASCNGYNYFGVEYGRECYCGNTLAASSVLAPNGDSECSVPCMGNTTELCGAGNRLTLYRLNGTIASSPSGTTTASGPTSTPAGNPTPTGPANKAIVGSYNYFGCQTESTTGRALSGATFAYNTMTIESCMANCAGFTYFGVEYGRECYCGNSFMAGSVPAPATDCSFTCPGDATELCGAGNRLSVYKFNAAIVSSSTYRTIATTTSTASATTISTASTTTTSIASATTTSTASATTTTTPSGPTIKKIIGSSSYYGCQTEGSNTRALSGLAYANNAMTLEMCIAMCAGFTYAGAEYGRECYCGNSFNAGSVVAPGGDADCSMVCPGNNLELCGAGNRLSVYKLGGSAGGSSSSTTSSVALSTTLTSPVTSSVVSTTSSSVANPSPSGPSHVKSVGSYNWVGCYTEATNMRALSSTSLINYNSMTVEMCAGFCGPTYSMFGLEYKGECYCGSSLNPGSVLASTGDCSMTCGGNSQEYCGAGNRLDVYQMAPASAKSTVSSVQVVTSSTSSRLPTSTSTTTTPISSTSTTTTYTPAYTGPPVISQGNVNFTYFDCVGEPSVGRALPQNIETNSVAMTVERCLGECWQYQFAGVEYGQECWCANTFTTGTSFNQTGCTMPCKGNSSEFCGGSVRLSVYKLVAH